MFSDSVSCDNGVAKEEGISRGRIGKTPCD